MDAAGYLTATTFDTESWDQFTVDGTVYSRSTGPVNQPVQSGAAVTWESGWLPGSAQGWRLCYSTAATTAPTRAPTPTPTLKTECGVFVDASGGSDSGTCGSSSSDACASIQRGIDNAQGHGDMVCISEGVHPSIRFRVVELFSLAAVLQVRTAVRVTGQLKLIEASPSRGLVLGLWSTATARDLGSESKPQTFLLCNNL